MAGGRMARGTTTVLRDVGRRVAELRVARELTQEAFAELAEVSVRYLREVEAGRENLTLVSLAKLAALLGADVAELFTSPRAHVRRPGRPRKAATKDPAASPSVTPASASQAAKDTTSSAVAAKPRKTRKRA